MITKAAIHSRYGDAHDVVAIKEVQLAPFNSGTVLVKMIYSPINPADINMCEGKYYVQPKLPCQLGNEGVGIVEDVSGNNQTVHKGDHVIIPFKSKDHWIGSWSQRVVVDAEDCVVIPKEIDLKQASMLTINPPTAYLLLTQFKSFKKGDWVVQNAANSSVGRWVIYWAKQQGLKIANIVRNKDQINQLNQLGSDLTIEFEPRCANKVKEVTGGVSLALNGVGGQIAIETLRTLRSNGVMVTYGAMSKEPVQVGNAALIYKTVSVTGFNRTKWLETTDRKAVKLMYNKILNIYKSKSISIPIAKVFPFSKIKDAINFSNSESRQGKVLIDWRKSN
ncbi:hypothetical protein DID75_00365 [Candidatus Marinamargulisbacteria bacterium SCGC AG-410-N11]|nr:hypothetical protein DID75_00365 [Candidatus Marinamargulisbacteria bacterium SCGC AG-410-N11]